MISNSALPSIRRHDASFLPSSSCRPTSPVFLGVSTCTLVGDGLQDRGAGRGGACLQGTFPQHLASGHVSRGPPCIQSQKLRSLKNCLVSRFDTCRARSRQHLGQCREKTAAPSTREDSRPKAQRSARCPSATRTAKARPDRGDSQGVYPSQPSPLRLLVLSTGPFRGKVFHAATRQKCTCFHRWEERRILFFLVFFWCSQLGGPEGCSGLDWVCFIS